MLKSWSVEQTLSLRSLLYDKLLHNKCFVEYKNRSQIYYRFHISRTQWKKNQLFFSFCTCGGSLFPKWKHTLFRSWPLAVDSLRFPKSVNGFLSTCVLAVSLKNHNKPTWDTWTGADKPKEKENNECWQKCYQITCEMKILQGPLYVMYVFPISMS